MEVQLVANVEIFMVHSMHSMLAWERNLINMRQRWEIGWHVAVRTVDVQVVEIMMAAMERVAMLMSHQVIVKGLHLQNKVAILGINLRRVEDTAVGIKSTTSFVPSATIKGVKIVAPSEIKFVVLFIKGIDFNVIVHDIPGHVRRIKAITP